MSDLRTRHSEATRRQILDATQRLVVEVHGWTLSMSEVADRAGVSRRTLYRYFATKEELLEAASREWAADDGDHVAFSSDDLDGLQQYLIDQWRTLAANLPAVLAQHASPTGRRMRERWLLRARQLATDAMAGVPVTGREREELVDLLLALMSSSMFLELVDRMDHEPDRAAQLVTWVVDSLVERAREDGGIHTLGT